MTTCAEAVRLARTASLAWRTLAVRERLVPVRALRRALASRADELVALLADELGKPANEVVGGELLPTADALAWLEKRAAALLAPRRAGDRPLWLWGQSDAVHRRPRGVVGVIGTWNYPLFLNGVQIAQALTAGNGVVWKPSEVVPRFAAWLAARISEAGYPPGLFQALPATREMGPALAEADVDHVVFTGSAPVGRKLAARLGERLVTSTLELSGCDGMLVLDDADLALAARAAWFGVSLNRGQTCIAVRRVFVPRARLDEFAALLREQASAAPMRLALPAAAAQARRLAEEAVAAGATPLLPISGQEGSVAPALLVGVRPEMALCQEAAFAPVLGILPYATLDQALEDEARCPFALAFSVFTADARKAEALAPRLRAGSVCVNDAVVPTAHPATPFGGRGESGWGSTQGAEGLLEMTVPQVVSTRGGTWRPHYPSRDARRNGLQLELLRGMLEAGHAATWWARMKGWWKLLRSAMRGGA